MAEIIVATGNRGKIREFQELFAAAGLTVKGQAADVEETGSTFEENASIKAEYLSRKCRGLVIADDSGIAVDALDGAPGVYSARYAGTPTSDEANNALLLQRLEGVENRAAKFVCVIALAENGKTIARFRGECAGSVAHAPKGNGGFGYDPIFMLPDGRSMAELSSEEKNRISHRRKAAEALLKYMESRMRLA